MIELARRDVSQLSEALTYLRIEFSAYGIMHDIDDTSTLGVESDSEELPLPTGRVNRVSELVVRAPVSVPPGGLPQEVRQILEQNGSWDLVRIIREIRFYPGNFWRFRNLLSRCYGKSEHDFALG